MEGYTKIGRIRPNYTGAWDSTVNYTALEMVKNEAGTASYIAKQDVPAGTPLTNADYWGEVLDVSDVIAESVAATNRANTAAANADAAREGIQDDLNGMRDELHAKGDAIVCTAEGETITLTDSSDDPMRGLVLFGKTTYDGEPSPDNPVTLVNKGEKGSIEVTTAGSNLVILTTLTPNGLPGIKASSGGDYTDAGGKQWICDEKDFGNGVHVKRTHIQYFDGSENWDGGTALDHVYYTTKLAYIAANSSPTLNTHGYYDKGIISIGTMYISGANNDEVYVYPDSNLFPTVESWKNWLAQQQASGTPFGIGFVLAAPIETPLTAEEIAAYRALHTNKPTTTIYNDEGAHMVVEYNADTKTYIDNKISELAAAIVNTNA